MADQGFTVSLQDATDLLSKFSSEQLPLQATLVASGRTLSMINGTLFSFEGAWEVRHTGCGFLRFDLSDAKSFGYADSRAFIALNASEKKPIDSALILVFPDETTLALMVRN